MTYDRGRGVVYLAERTDAEFQKLVAVKLVPRALLSDDLLWRFHQERQIPASLAHPNIARLLEGGTTPDGHPCLVMEYVEGKPLDEYCRQHQLSLAGRLRLLRKLCAAVHFHQSLIVHRDLKPANLLITNPGFWNCQGPVPRTRSPHDLRESVDRRLRQPRAATGRKVQAQPGGRQAPQRYLDAITIRAIEKEPERRYVSADEMSAEN